MSVPGVFSGHPSTTAPAGADVTDIEWSPAERGDKVVRRSIGDKSTRHARGDEVERWHPRPDRNCRYGPRFGGFSVRRHARFLSSPSGGAGGTRCRDARRVRGREFAG